MPYASTKDLPPTVKSKYKGKKLRQWLHVWNSEYKAHGDESRAFASAWSAVKKDFSDALSGQAMTGVGGRTVQAFDDDTMYIPFRYDPSGMSYLRPDQVPRFLDAVTHPKMFPKTTVNLQDLVAIKSRVGRKTVAKHLRNIDDLKPPVVVKMNGALYIGDGHDRLVAIWLNGSDQTEVRFADVEYFDDTKPDPTNEHDGSLFELLQGVPGRSLTCYKDGTLAIPFTYDIGFFSKLRPDQVPKFLNAITHPDDQDEETIPLDTLIAIQNRINANTVAAFVEKPSKTRPVIVRINGINHIADGHDRLSARWLTGADNANVVVKDISWMDNLMKVDNTLSDYSEMHSAAASSWSMPVSIKKVDQDRQMVFGWASVIMKDGAVIVDKQGDMIPVEELENAAYNYIMHSRDAGDMHERKGVGQCIESIVFTPEKQQALGIDLGGTIGWWTGFYISNEDTWQKFRDGTYGEFSIGGVAIPKYID